VGWRRVNDDELRGYPRSFTVPETGTVMSFLPGTL